MYVVQPNAIQTSSSTLQIKISMIQTQKSHRVTEKTLFLVMLYDQKNRKKNKPCILLELIKKRWCNCHCQAYKIPIVDIHQGFTVKMLLLEETWEEKKGLTCLPQQSGKIIFISLCFKMHYLSKITLGTRLPEYHTSSSPKATDFFLKWNSAVWVYLADTKVE